MQCKLRRSETRRKLMGSRAARSLLGPLVDGYRDLEPTKQTLSRPGVNFCLDCNLLLLFPSPLHPAKHTSKRSSERQACSIAVHSHGSQLMLLLQTAKGQTWARSQWEEMDLGGGGGGAKAAEIFKSVASFCDCLCAVVSGLSIKTRLCNSLLEGQSCPCILTAGFVQCSRSGLGWAQTFCDTVWCSTHH